MGLGHISSSPIHDPVREDRAGSWMVRTLAPLDRYVIERSHGRYTVLGPIGAPTMLLTTTGALSGLSRTTPLLFARDGDDILVAGEQFRSDEAPGLE